MKKLLTYLILSSAAIVANADNWVRDTESADTDEKVQHRDKEETNYPHDL